VHLWTVPAKVEGLWCGTGPLRGASLRLSQKFQEVDGVLSHRNRTRDVTGRMQGTQLQAAAGRHTGLTLEHVGDALRITSGEGDWAVARGMRMEKARGSSCA